MDTNNRAVKAGWGGRELEEVSGGGGRHISTIKIFFIKTKKYILIAD